MLKTYEDYEDYDDEDEDYDYDCLEDRLEASLQKYRFTYKILPTKKGRS